MQSGEDGRLKLEGERIESIRAERKLSIADVFEEVLIEPASSVVFRQVPVLMKNDIENPNQLTRSSSRRHGGL